MRRKTLLGAVLAILFTASAASAAGAAAPVQLPGAAGCITAGHEAGCARGRAIDEAVGPLAISPDGRSAYLVANSNPEGIESDALDVFDRDPSTGALTQKPGAEGCLAASGREGCAPVATVLGGHEAVVSPDGRNVYLANERGVVAFSRDTTTGALAPLSGPGECLGGKKVKAPCEIGVGLSGANSLAISPDGAELYVTSDAHPTVAILRRDPLTGALSQAGGAAGCVVAAGGPRDCDAGTIARGSGAAIAIAPDGHGAYAIVNGETPKGLVSTRLESFARDAAGGLRRLGGRAHAGCLHPLHGRPCPGGRGLRAIEGLALSPDGRSLYLTSGYSAHAGAISIFRRGPGNSLSQAAGKQACLSVNGGECRVDEALAFAGEVAVSPDGTGVYVDTLYGIAVLARDEAGQLTAPRGKASCVSTFRSSCVQARGLEATTGLAVSPDAKNLYVTSLEPGGVSVFIR